MTSKQKKQMHNFVQSTFKIVGCAFLFIGMTMALGVNPHMELTSYLLLFVGTLLIMIHSFRDNDHMYLLVSSAGFVLVGGAFLDTETAIMIANNYGIALTEEQGWFAKYGKVFVEIIKAVT